MTKFERFPVSLLLVLVAVNLSMMGAEARPLNYGRSQNNSGSSDNRNFKKGLAMATAESCNALAEHETSSWWYSWGARSGFSDSFCLDTESAVQDARDSGMEFVPMFWSGLPSFDSTSGLVFDDEIHANLEHSRYLLTFNEPELEGQANLSPAQAAQMWSSVETIAAAYGVEIVAPCVTQDHGVAWYEDWIVECNSLYGRDCDFDFTCLHMYYQPYTSNPDERCDSSDYEWACIQQGGEQGPTRAEYKLNQWATNYPGKQIWVTEYACAPWGSSEGCSPREHTDIMNQLTPLLEESPDVFRYNWFGLYGGEEHSEDWYGNGLNENVWTRYEGVGCQERTWIEGFGTDGWQIQTKQECLESADANENCAKPLKLSMDDDSCYCAPTTASECNLVSTWGAMVTWVETASRGLGLLTEVGELYETFGATAPPSPTAVPTETASAPPSETPIEVPATEAPSEEPSLAQTEPPSETPSAEPTKQQTKKKCKKVENKKKFKFWLDDETKKKMKCKQIKKKKLCKRIDLGGDPLYLTQCPHSCKKKIPEELLDDFWCKL